MRRVHRYGRPCLLAAGGLSSGAAFANVAVPGSLLWFSASLVSAGIGWVIICMTLCILVEWAVYRYSRQYCRPLLASGASNAVSLIAGLPLGLLAVVDPTWFILPTIASIIVEYWTIVAIRRFVLAPGVGKVNVAPVLWGNVTTNLMILGLMYVARLKEAYGVLAFW